MSLPFHPAQLISKESVPHKDIGLPMSNIFTPPAGEAMGYLGRISVDTNTLHPIHAMHQPSDIGIDIVSVGTSKHGADCSSACIVSGAPERNRGTPCAAEGLLELGHLRGKDLEKMAHLRVGGAQQASIDSSNSEHPGAYVDRSSQGLSYQEESGFLPPMQLRVSQGQEWPECDPDQRQNSPDSMQRQTDDNTVVKAARARNGKPKKIPRHVLVSPNEGCFETPVASKKASHKQVSILEMSPENAKALVSPPEEHDKESNKGSKKSSKDKQEVPAFAQLAFNMVTETALSQPEIIDWIADGEAFIVHDQGRKLGAVLEKYFRHTKYSSLQRQLNMYGWKKYTTGRYKGAFHHPYFHRDLASPAELSKIQRNVRHPGKAVLLKKKTYPPRTRKRSKKASHVDETLQTTPARKESKPMEKPSVKKRRTSTVSRNNGARQAKKRSASSSALKVAPKTNGRTSRRSNSSNSTVNATPSKVTQETASAVVAESKQPLQSSYVPSQPPKKRRPVTFFTKGNGSLAGTSKEDSTLSSKKIRQLASPIASTWATEEVGLSPSACWSPLIEDFKMPEPELVDEKKRKHLSGPSYGEAARCLPSATMEHVPRKVNQINMPIFRETVTLTSSSQTQSVSVASRARGSASGSLVPVTCGTRVEQLYVTPTRQVESGDLAPPLSLSRARSSPSLSIPAPEPFLRASTSSFFLPFAGMANALSTALGVSSNSEDATCQSVAVGAPGGQAKVSRCLMLDETV